MAETVRATLADLQSHRSAWRAALEIALRHADLPGVDHDDPSYWRHEMAVFDRVFDQVPALIAERDGLTLNQRVARIKGEEWPRYCNARMENDRGRAKYANSSREDCFEAGIRAALSQASPS